MGARRRRQSPASDFEATIGESIGGCEGQMSLKIGNDLWKTRKVVYFLLYQENNLVRKTAKWDADRVFDSVYSTTFYSTAFIRYSGSGIGDSPLISVHQA